MSNASTVEWIWVIGNAIGLFFCLALWAQVTMRGRKIRATGYNGALRILYILKHGMCFVLSFAEFAFALLGLQALFLPPPQVDRLREQQQAVAWVFIFVPIFIIAYVVAELAYRHKLDQLIDRAEAMKLLQVPTEAERANAEQVIRDTEPGGAT